jgi:hypothetical protein
MDPRVVLGCALAAAIAAGAWALARGSDYEARSFVIRLPPGYAGERGLERARREPVLERALAAAGEGDQGPGWLRERSSVELTSRLDLSFVVHTPDREDSIALANAYATAYRQGIPPQPGLIARVRVATAAERDLGPFGWTLLGGAAGLWLGMALAILLEARARARTA